MPHLLRRLPEMLRLRTKQMHEVLNKHVSGPRRVGRQIGILLEGMQREVNQFGRLCNGEKNNLGRGRE